MHRIRTALSIAGIALGVMLLFAALISNASLTGSLDRLNQNLRGSADLEVTPPALAGIDMAQVNRVQAVPRVRVAAPTLQEHALLSGPRGTVEVSIVGYDNRLLALSPASIGSRRQQVVG